MARQEELPPLVLPRKRLSAAWREHVLGRVLDLNAELDAVRPGLDASLEPVWREAKERLRNTLQSIEKRPGIKSAWTGVDVERGWVNVHSVEVTLMRLSEPHYVAAKLPEIIADAEQVLPKNDPRLDRLRNYQLLPELDENAKRSVAQMVAAVHSATAEAHLQARSFRNILLATAFALTVFAVGFALLGWFSPQTVNLCATQAQPALTSIQSQAEPTCPTGGYVPSRRDVLLIELIGLFSAALVGSLAIRQMTGTATPYAIPLASLLVKLPAGAMTAVGGLLFMRAGILGPPIAASATAQVLAYSLVFGASQQTFTRLIDQQAQNVLYNVPSAGTSTPPPSAKNAPPADPQPAPSASNQYPVPAPIPTVPPAPIPAVPNGSSQAAPPPSVPTAVADTPAPVLGNSANSRWG